MGGSILSIIRRLVFRLLGYHHYDYQEILEKYGFALSRPMTDLHRLSLMLPYLLIKSMRLTVASVMILDPEYGFYKVHAVDGDKCQIDGQLVRKESLLVQELTARKKELFMPDVVDNNAIFQEMEKLSARLIIPAVSESFRFAKPTLLFSINLGRILSGEDFTDEDIAFLKKFVSQIMVNLEQAFVS